MKTFNFLKKPPNRCYHMYFLKIFCILFQKSLRMLTRWTEDKVIFFSEEEIGSNMPLLPKYLKQNVARVLRLGFFYISPQHPTSHPKNVKNLNSLFLR